MHIDCLPLSFIALLDLNNPQIKFAITYFASLIKMYFIIILTKIANKNVCIITQNQDHP